MSSSTSTTPGNTSEADAPTTHSENAQLSHFRIETIQNDDKMVSFYTGFTSYMVFCAFYEFLGPAVDHLNYWGAKEVQQQRRSRPRKLNPNESALSYIG